MEPLLDDGNQHIHRDGGPDLGLHRILGGPVEGLDPQVLLDPLEEQLDLPPALVELGDGEGRERTITDRTSAGIFAKREASNSCAPLAV